VNYFSLDVVINQSFEVFYLRLIALQSIVKLCIIFYLLISIALLTKKDIIQKNWLWKLVRIQHCPRNGISLISPIHPNFVLLKATMGGELMYCISAILFL